MSADAIDSESPLNEFIEHQMDKAIRAITEHQLKSIDHDAPGMDPAVSENPWAYFNPLREQGHDVIRYIGGKFEGVRTYNAFGRDTPIFGVIGYDALRQMVLDKETFINAGAYGPQMEGQQAGFAIFNELDGVEHRTVRKVFESKVFSREHITTWTDKFSRPIARFLVDRIHSMLMAEEPVDLTRDLALPYAYMTMSSIIGVDLTHMTHLVELGERVNGGQRNLESATKAAEELQDYFYKMYQERMDAGDLNKDDLMSLLHNAEIGGARFSTNEIVVYCRFFLPAGIETTFRQMANMSYCLMTHPDQYKALKSGGVELQGAIEEMLRWMPSGFILPRIAAKDTELAGVEIPAGSSMYGIFGVANRDSRIWTDADRLDLARPYKPHLTFSAGPHACVGQQLARRMFDIALRTIMERLPDIELDASPAEVRTTGFLIRCPDNVPVRAVSKKSIAGHQNYK